MPQSASDTKATDTKATVKTVGDNAADMFTKMLDNVFGGNKTATAPSVDQPGSMTPGVVGGLPPNMTTPPTRLSTPPPPVPIQQQPSLSPTRGIAPAGSSYDAGGAREAAAASFGDAIVQAIQAGKNKKDSENVAKAQNTLNMFLHAVQQNDMKVANLLATDPKITASWEKYLKQEYPRVPGTPTKQEATPSSDASKGIMPTQTTPLAPGTGNINEPGGIGVARDMTPEGQIKERQLAAINRYMSTLSDEQVAKTASVPGMALTGLSDTDSKKATMFQYGLALTPEQNATLDANLKAHMATTWADMIKSITQQQEMTARTGAMTASQQKVAETNRQARLDVAKEYIKGNKDLQKLKGTALQTGTYTALINGQNALALQAEKELKDIPKNTYGGFGGDNPLYTAKQAEVARYQQNAKDIQSQYDGFKIAQELGIFDQEAAKPDETPAVPAAEQP